MYPRIPTLRFLVFFGSQKDGINDIKVISIAGSDLTRVYPDIKNPDPILTFNGTIYWLNENGDLFSHPFPQQMGETPKHFYIGQNILILNVLIISPLLQPSKNDPCESSSCSDLCLRTEFFPFYKCACPTGITFKMVENGERSKTECNTDPEHVMVLAQTRDLKYTACVSVT